MKDAWAESVGESFKDIKLALENLIEQRHELMTALQEALPLIKPSPENTEGLTRVRNAVGRCIAANDKLKGLLHRNEPSPP